jgi:hypothetical protein
MASEEKRVYMHNKRAEEDIERLGDFATVVVKLVSVVHLSLYQNINLFHKIHIMGFKNSGNHGLVVALHGGTGLSEEERRV